MNIRTCTHEAEIKQHIQQGRWPDACDPELRAHVAACAACAETVQFAQLFQTARAESMLRAPLDSAGPLWWRAQLRRRNAALESIVKPIRTAQIFAAAICLIATIGFLVFQLRSGNSWLSNLRQLWPFASTTGWSLTLLISSVGLLTVVAVAALFFAADANETRGG
jgi:hypothetical protein